MPKIVDAAAQRRQIRRAARRVFARRGVARTGLAHVAERAGMGRSTLYHYYPDKAALVRDLARELWQEEGELFAAALQDEGSPLERIERLIHRLTGIFGAWAALGRLVYDLRTLDASRFRAFFRRARCDLARLIIEGQHQGEIERALEPELAAAGVIGLVDGVLLQQFVEPAAFDDANAMARALTSSVHKMLQP